MTGETQQTPVAVGKLNIVRNIVSDHKISKWGSHPKEALLFT